MDPTRRENFAMWTIHAELHTRPHCRDRQTDTTTCWPSCHHGFTVQYTWFQYTLMPKQTCLHLLDLRIPISLFQRTAQFIWTNSSSELKILSASDHNRSNSRQTLFMVLKREIMSFCILYRLLITCKSHLIFQKEEFNAEFDEGKTGFHTDRTALDK